MLCTLAQNMFTIEFSLPPVTGLLGHPVQKLFRFVFRLSKILMQTLAEIILGTLWDHVKYFLYKHFGLKLFKKVKF